MYVCSERQILILADKHAKKEFRILKVVHIFRGLPFSLLPVLLFIARRILYKIKGIDVLVCVIH